MIRFAFVTLALLMAGPAWAGDEPGADSAPASPSARFSPAQIEQMVAPIALYPDAITVQVLMAATYPLEIVEAARWRAKNPGPQGDALDKELQSHNWDPSVGSLTHFPDLLQRMSDNLDWTKDMGDAFLGQKDQVLDAVQRMRAKAYEAGTLKTTKEQVVTREVVNQKETIVIQPADPQVVYVPQYSPAAVYGPPPTPYYPAMYAYPPGYVATTSLLSFGAGMAVGAAVWGDCDWGSNDVHVTNNYNNNNTNNNNNNNNNGGGNNNGGNNNRPGGGNGNRPGGGNRPSNQPSGGGRQNWQHNPEHRGGVGYRDQASQKKFGGKDQVAARDRGNAARGYDRGNQPAGGARPSQTPAGGGSQAGASRPGAGQGQQGGQRPGGSASQQPATRPGGAGGRQQPGGAFGGYESGRSARDASSRGAASRGAPSYAGGGGGGSRGGGGFGGGGGGSRGGGGGGGGGRGGGGRGGGGGGRGGRR